MVLPVRLAGRLFKQQKRLTVLQAAHYRMAEGDTGGEEVRDGYESQETTSRCGPHVW